MIPRKQNRRSRRWPIAMCGAVLIAVLAGGSGCQRNEASSANQEEEAVLISPERIAVVRQQTLESGVTFTGELLPIETVEVNARFESDLEKVLVREGEAVAKGEHLAVFRPHDIRDRLAAAEAQVLAARAALTAAENAERRVERLKEAGAASPRDLEAAQTQHAAAQAQLDAAQSVRNTAQEDADRISVPSPIAGRVSRVFVHAGDRASIGDPLFTIVNTRELELSATLPSDAAMQVATGTPIAFQLEAFPGEMFTGQIDRINPVTEPGTRQMRVYMRVPNPEDRLAGGLFASGRVIQETHENAAAAPVGVIRKEGAEQVVYRLQDGRAQRIVVRTGLLDESAGVIELLGSVQPGDSLLTGVLPGLRDSVRVRMIGTATGAGEILEK